MPVRAAPVLDATVYPILPLPTLLVALVKLIQFTLVEAFHPHVGVAVTLTDPLPPFEPNDWLLADSE